MRVGVDLVDVAAFQARFDGRDDLLADTFSPAELAYCRAQKSPWTHLAARFADQVLLLSEGRAVARGAPGDVLTAETVQNVFAWPMAITSFDGRPQMIPLRTKETNP